MAEAISNKFLDSGDLFGMEFEQGFLFFEVRSWEETKFKPHTVLSDISSQDDSGFTRLTDGSSESNDILFLEDRHTKVIHAAIGHRPVNLRRYTRYPEGSANLRQIPNLTTASARNGDDYGYVDGHDSPYSEPTDAEELFIPPGIHLEFDFYNPDKNDDADPVLNIKMRIYEVRTLDPRDDNDLNAIKRILSPGSPIPIAKAGNLTDQVSVAEIGLDQRPLPKDNANATKLQELSNRGGR